MSRPTAKYLLLLVCLRMGSLSTEFRAIHFDFNFAPRAVLPTALRLVGRNHSASTRQQQVNIYITQTILLCLAIDLTEQILIQTHHSTSQLPADGVTNTRKPGSVFSLEPKEMQCCRLMRILATYLPGARRENR